MTKARALLPRIIKNRKVAVKADRGTYGFEYAALAAILDAVIEPLTSHGLVPLLGVCEATDGSAQEGQGSATAPDSGRSAPSMSANPISGRNGGPQLPMASGTASRHYQD